LSPLNKELKIKQFNSIHKHKNKLSIIKICLYCKKEFIPKKSEIQSCSIECRKALASKRAKANPNCGGETHFKRYSYRGVMMDSSWEVNLAKWLDEKQIKWIRDRRICLYWRDKDDDIRRYYPDFYLPDYNCYLEPKNKYLQQKDCFKLNSIKEQGIKLFDGFLDDIKRNVSLFIGLVN